MPKRIRIIFPAPLGENTRALVESQLPHGLIRPGFAVEFVGSNRLMSLANSYYDMYIMDSIVIEAGLRAEEDGCSGVCINTVSDSGLEALRSRLSIPVFGSGQTALNLACTLGHRFGILTMWAPWIPLYRKVLRTQGIEHRCAGIRHIDTRPDVRELLEGKESFIFDKLEKAAVQLIEEDGADVIVLGSTTMHQSHAYLSGKLPIPILNPGVVAYKTCELAIELNLTHSKHAYPAPETLQDEALFPAAGHACQ